MASKLALFGGSPVVDAAAHRRWPLVEDADRRAVAAVLDRGVLSGMFAPEAVALETEFAAFVGAENAQLTHSGTSALQIALAAVGVGEGDEVIVPAYSFVATPLAVVHQGAIPIFVDVDPISGLIDTSAIDAALTPRTRALMPVHVHGCPCDLDEVLA
ncbi:MAG TPA: aminotransferase class I/II-fold pyridoxal phosphate-dependent enzyme, partial [Polyangiaceae bacterium]